MKIINVEQGSKPWLELRAKYNTASEASVMMTKSTNMTRDQLLNCKYTHEEFIVSDYVKNVVFKKGHYVEELARPFAEKIIGKDLYPITAIDDDGELLASYDGMTMDESICWECKQWNEDKAAQVSRGRIPDEDIWQVIQQLALGVSKCLYMISDGTPEKTVHCWISDDDPRVDYNALLGGWAQFDADLNNYTPVVIEEKPEPTAIMELPTLNIQLTGKVDNSNLVLFQGKAIEFINNINTILETDQHFADAELMVKFCGDTESKLDLVKEQALSQTADIDELFKAIDKMRADFRTKRLELDKLVKKQKESIKVKIVNEGVSALNDHIDTLNKQFNRAYVSGKVDFMLAIKGKRTITSIRSAVNDALAAVKIETSAQATKVAVNVKTITEFGSDHKFLFSDLAQIIYKEADDFELLVKSRISEHEAAEKVKADEKAKDEEQARMDAEATKPDPEPISEAGLTEEQQNNEVKSNPIQFTEENIGIAGFGGSPTIEQTAVARGELLKNIIDDLVSNGIGKITAKKVADLLVNNKIKRVHVS